MASNLTTQSSKVSMIFNLPLNDINRSKYEYMILEWLRSVSSEYYFIYHNKDIHVETGELKTPHFHILAVLSKDRPRLLTTLTSFAETLGLSDKQRCLISVEVWKDHDAGIQYLIHKNSPDKYQYEFNDVYTNLPEMFQAVINKEIVPVITVEYLMELIQRMPYRTMVYRTIGLERAKLYRNIINDMWNDIKLMNINGDNDKLHFAS